MIPNLQNYLTQSIGSLTWNNQWISDFESPWSIFEKIKFLNNASKKDIFYLFGTSKIKKQKTINGDANHNLYHLVSMDNNRLIDLLGFDLKQYNNDILYNLSGFLKGGKQYTSSINESLPHFFRLNFTYCSECLKTGYHSLLHQFEFLHNCPFHQTTLLDDCPECKQKFPYILSDTHFESPYTCKCGYHFRNVTKKYPLSIQWGKYSSSDLKDNTLIDWLMLNEEEQNKLGFIYLYPFTDKKIYPQLMSLYLRIIGLTPLFRTRHLLFKRMHRIA